MGGVWVHNLPQILSAAGLPFRTWAGWESRSRSSGGYDDILAIGTHHTASNASPDNDCRYMWNNASSRPIGAVLLDRTGLTTIGAAGATNTQGAGGPRTTSRGTTPVDQANRLWFSIEAANAGTGEPWPTIQQDNYLRLCRALADAFNLDVNRDVLAHFEWTSRKIDQAGNSRYANGGASWNMAAFRRDIAALGPTPDPGPGPGPGPTPQPEDDVTTVLILDDVRPPGPRYKVNANTKSWVPDGNASAQITARLAESNGGTQPAIDGFTYTYMQHGGDDVIASYGPIVGQVPDGFDDYGRKR